MRDDREDFTAWAVSRQHALLRTAYLLSGDLHRAQDLVQETLIKVASRWPRLRDGDPEAYARTILVRDNISWWRRHRREHVTDDVRLASSDDHAALVDRKLLVAAALDQLTAKQRSVLVLRYYDDLTERATAAALGVSVGTVKAQAHTALARLRAVAPELGEFLGKAN